ncbi:KTSC domain-containing protein [Agromyces sp. NPDC004153]
MQPEMELVQSSNVEAIGYDADSSELWVQYWGGKTYIYDNVPDSTYHELIGASSIGSYMNRQIKPNYQFRHP